jgi:hypothetical protein
MFISVLLNFYFYFLYVFSSLIVLEQETGKVSDRLAIMLYRSLMGALQIQMSQLLQTRIIAHRFMCQKAC